MIKKKLGFLVKRYMVKTCVIVGLAVGLWGINAQGEEDPESLRVSVRTSRKDIVKQAMNLSKEEGQVFWPVYNEYRNEAKPIIDRTITLIEDFIDNYDDLTDEMSKTMLKQFLDIQYDDIKLKKKYVKQFDRVLKPQQVLSYYQIENKIDPIIDYSLVLSIPLAEMPESQAKKLNK